VTTPDRRITNDDRFMEIEQRLDAGAKRMDRIETKLDDNTAATSEVLEILRSAKGFFRVLGYLGTFTKWVVTICAGVAAVFATWKTGGKL